MTTVDTLSIPASLKDNVDRAFALMNWFASGESQNQGPRAEPLAILTEVYQLLAPVSIALQSASEVSNGQ